MRRGRWALGAVLAASMWGFAGPPAQAAAGKVSVVAAEDFWGSIARQLAGEHTEVTSLIADPNTEPHDYEAKPSDGVTVAKARVAIVNGIGYDPWMGELLEANPSSSRKVVTVGDVVGVKEGGNPHQWYSPRSVSLVIDAITEALKQADPADAASFDTQRQRYRTEGLKRYNDLRAQIKDRFSGVEVGATESIVAPLAEDLGLKLITPESFIDAVSEGNEPTAKDKTTVDKQITGKQIKVLVYNSQNSTPDVESLVAKAKKAGIPVMTVTETLPTGATFQDWQADQLQGLSDALARSTGSTAPAVSAAQTPDAGAPERDAAAPTPAAATSPGGDTATPSATAPSSALASTGTTARWLMLLAGSAFVLGGLGLAGGAASRRNRRPLPDA